MKDFLSDLLNKDEIEKNPFKAFAGFTALKFDENDKVIKEHEKKLDDHEKHLTQIEDKKLNQSDFNKFIREYDINITRITVKVTIYAAVSVFVLDMVVLIILAILKIKI